MKPANFPGRKWLRQQRALSRLKAFYKKGGQSTDKERTALFSRVSIGQERARDIRTKKDRSARAKLRVA